MNRYDFIYEKLSVILVNLFSALALTIFLKLIGTSNAEIIIILFCWSIILTFYLLLMYYKLCSHYKQMQQRLDGLDQKYLICEILDKPSTIGERVYYEMLREANKSMLEEVGKAKEGQLSYKEYIEGWIHEIKTPITAIDLICKNNESASANRIGKELQSIEYLVNQALFYARSEIVEQDYFVKKVRLFDIVQKSILKNRTAFLENHITLEVDETEEIVWTDEKWLSFILDQIMINAVKYRKKEEARLHIYSKALKNGVSLSIEDNGIGISETELPRIFDKGFTGTNRADSKSTGLGLYLCKKLCDKLGLSIIAESEKDRFTRLVIVFPIGKVTGECIE
jgi:signal transduction histidine kinase